MSTILQYEEEHKQREGIMQSISKALRIILFDKTEISEEEIARLMAFTGPMNVFRDVLIIYPDPDRGGYRNTLCPP